MVHLAEFALFVVVVDFVIVVVVVGDDFVVLLDGFVDVDVAFVLGKAIDVLARCTAGAAGSSLRPLARKPVTKAPNP